MPIRLSITIDSETMDLIDKFAKEEGIDRNRAILECIQTGIQKINAGEQVSLPETTTPRGVQGNQGCLKRDQNCIVESR